MISGSGGASGIESGGMREENGRAKRCNAPLP